MLTLQVNAVTITVIAIVVIAVILALLYRLGYLGGGRRGEKGQGETLEQVIPQYKPEQKPQQTQQRQRQGPTLPTQEVTAGQGSRHYSLRVGRLRLGLYKALRDQLILRGLRGSLGGVLRMSWSRRLGRLLQIPWMLLFRRLTS
ncbi:hypothetical protein [Vulcanisaeta distributa]|uniref:hypothetical protein n=1 Tax=Vulcanisaeta distributa TaxID=164451 RepID=UPI000AFDBBDD|nr:hypothetical protein [Vulcanisaeta distributa]